MDVKADDARLRPDPSATALVERPVTDSQGQLFNDGYPTYADTDKIPAYRAGGPVRSGPARSLRVLVVLVAVIVVAAGATLGLVKAGVIDKSGTGSPKVTSTTTHHAAAPASKAPLVTQVSTGAGTATYRVATGAYVVTVTTTTGRSWVSIGSDGQSAELRGCTESEQLPEAIPSRPLPGRCRRGRDQGDRDVGQADLHADAHLGAVQLPVRPQDLKARPAGPVATDHCSPGADGSLPPN